MTKLQFLDKASKRSDELVQSIEGLEARMKKTDKLPELRKIAQELDMVRLELRFNTEVTIDLK